MLLCLQYVKELLTTLHVFFCWILNAWVKAVVFDYMGTEQLNCFRVLCECLHLKRRKVDRRRAPTSWFIYICPFCMKEEHLWMNIIILKENINVAWRCGTHKVKHGVGGNSLTGCKTSVRTTSASYERAPDWKSESPLYTTLFNLLFFRKGILWSEGYILIIIS